MPLATACHASGLQTRHCERSGVTFDSVMHDGPEIEWRRPAGARYGAPQRINAYPYRWQFAGLWAEIPPVTVPKGSPMDANSFVILAAVVTLFSFNLTASLMCCRSLGRRVDRLEHRLDRLEDRMDRFEQVLMQLVVDMTLVKADMALVKAKLGIETATPSAAQQPAIAPPSGGSSGAAAQ